MNTLFAVCLLSVCPGAYSHGYLSKPKSRNHLRCNGEFYCETHVGTQNVHGLPQPVYPNNLAGVHPGMGRIAEPVCASGLEDGRHRGLEKPGPVEATFKAGETIDVTIEIQANHGGHYAFRLCTDASGTEDCFSQHYLQFEDGQTWKRLVHDSKGGSNYLRDRVKLPQNVGCDKCVLSWRWDSGDRPGEGGDESAIFVNCIDVRITGGSGASNPPDGNLVTYYADGVGGWGGSCTCPDGQVYQVGDNGDACGSLACIDGTPGTCNRNDGAWSFRQVSCAKGSSMPKPAPAPTPSLPKPSPSPAPNTEDAFNAKLAVLDRSQLAGILKALLESGLVAASEVKAVLPAHDTSQSPTTTTAPAPTPIALKPKSIGTATLELNLHEAANKGGAKVTLSFSPVGSDKARFEVQVNRLGWIGFGISTGTTGLMTGGGLGTDAVVCSDGQVKRHWLRSYSGLSEEDSSEELEDASCNQADGSTRIMFTRNIAATGNMQRPLTPGIPQPVVVAWGDDGANKANYHQGRQGMHEVDFGSAGSAAADASLLSLASAQDVTFALSLVMAVIVLVLTAEPEMIMA